MQRRWLSLLALVSVFSCAKGNTEWCAEQLEAARTQLDDGRLNESERILTEAYSRCRSQSVTEVKALRDALSEKRRQLKRSKVTSEAEQATKERLTQPSLDFVHWALEHRGALPSELGEAACAERGKADYGFCEASRPSAPHMSVRFWQKDPMAARYSLSTREALSCQDVGEHRQLPSWKKGEAQHTLCELTERRFRHLSALLVQAPEGNVMHIFSRSYLEHDEDFARAVAPAGAPK